VIEMKGLVLPMAAITIAGLFLATRAHPAYAMCPDLTVEEQVQSAHIIVTGTVSQVDMVPPLDEESPDDLVHTFQAVLTVDEYLKGSGPDTLTIPSTAHSFFFDDEGHLVEEMQSPGIDFEGSAGKRYILFLQGEVGSLIPDACSSKTITQDDQQLIEDVRSAIAAAEALPPTGSAPAGDQTGDGTPWLPIIGSSLGLTLLAGGGWLTLRAWRRA
jgi:hypothetical protein